MDIIATLPFVASRSNLPEQTCSKPSIYAEDTKKTFLISSSSKDKDTKSPTVNPGSKLLWDPEWAPYSTTFRRIILIMGSKTTGTDSHIQP